MLTEDDGDPLSVVVNLFDVAMVFAVSLMVAMVMHMNMAEVFGSREKGWQVGIMIAPGVLPGVFAFGIE